MNTRWTNRSFSRLIPAVLLCNLLGSWSCVSFKIPIPNDPEAVVAYTAILKSVSKESDFSKTLPSESITTNDPSACALVKILNLSQPATLQWCWYNPAGELVKTSKEVEVNSKKKYLEYVVAWDIMASRYFKDQPGKWSVVVRISGAYLCRLEFEIIKI